MLPGGLYTHREEVLLQIRGLLQVWHESWAGWKFVGKGSKQGNELSPRPVAKKEKELYVMGEFAIF